MAKPKVIIAWSSGKDSAWALHVIRQEGRFEVAGLLTTITEPYDRVSMHGVRTELLEAQARSLGLPLHKIMIPSPCSNDAYERAMGVTLSRLKVEGVNRVVHGDLFLQSVRDYREKKLSEVGMEALFPLWGRDTGELAREMIAGGLKARVSCLDPRKTPRALAGHLFDEEFLSKLPERTDPLGERGEFHTFCFGGPMFSEPIPISVGETVEREGFVFTDIVI